MKWVVSTVITIILVPKLQPIVSDYIGVRIHQQCWSWYWDIYFNLIFNDCHW